VLFNRDVPWPALGCKQTFLFLPFCDKLSLMGCCVRPTVCGSMGFELLHRKGGFALEQLSFDFNTSNAVTGIDSFERCPKSGEYAKLFDENVLGAVFTRPEVVEFILDLVGYNPEHILYNTRILEPSFGGGAFLGPIIRRLFDSWRLSHSKKPTLADLKGAIYAVELHGFTYLNTRRKIIQILEREGMNLVEAEELSAQWLFNGDFLLTAIAPGFDFIVGNPPYVRQEVLPDYLLSEYRKRYGAMNDRADLYVPFFERSLSLLKEGGVLGFICADRWIKNRYGASLRKLIASGYRLRAYVDMTDADPFHSGVSAYPAITIIGREPPGSTKIARRPKVDSVSLSALASELLSPTMPNSGMVRKVTGITKGSEPWVLDSPGVLSIIRRLETDFPTIEEAGCSVGIGVATGADNVFIGDYEALDIEPDRKLPLVMTNDIISGEVRWLGKGVVNPFKDDGSLVDLNNHPKLRRYLEKRREIIENRHCAKKNPRNWYRTIDRIHPSLATREKLLIPDIKKEAHVVYEQGKLYPHHNLYYIMSSTWDLRALQAVLLSSVSLLFISAYSTKMRGGYLRFQAQYLRRIRIPKWRNVPDSLRKELVQASTKRNLNKCDKAVFRLYNLTDEERSVIEKSEKNDT
jgi:hypothetical protein